MSWKECHCAVLLKISSFEHVSCCVQDSPSAVGSAGCRSVWTCLSRSAVRMPQTTGGQPGRRAAGGARQPGWGAGQRRPGAGPQYVRQRPAGQLCRGGGDPHHGHTLLEGLLTGQPVINGARGSSGAACGCQLSHHCISKRPPATEVYFIL